LTRIHIYDNYIVVVSVIFLHPLDNRHNFQDV